MENELEFGAEERRMWRARRTRIGRSFQPEQAAEAKARFASTPLRDPARLAPAIAFNDAKGMLSLPAQRHGHQIFWRAERFRRRREGTFSRDAPEAPLFRRQAMAISRSGPVAELWTTLDHQRRRRLLCRLGGHGSDRRGCRTIRPRWRAGRRPWATARRKRRLPSRLARRSRSFMSNFAKTGRQSIRVHGGRSRTMQRVRG